MSELQTYFMWVGVSFVSIFLLLGMFVLGMAIWGWFIKATKIDQFYNHGCLWFLALMDKKGGDAK